MASLAIRKQQAAQRSTSPSATKTSQNEGKRTNSIPVHHPCAIVAKKFNSVNDEAVVPQVLWPVQNSMWPTSEMEVHGDFHAKIIQVYEDGDGITTTNPISPPGSKTPLEPRIVELPCNAWNNPNRQFTFRCSLTTNVSHGELVNQTRGTLRWMHIGDVMGREVHVPENDENADKLKLKNEGIRTNTTIFRESALAVYEQLPSEAPEQNVIVTKLCVVSAQHNFANPVSVRFSHEELPGEVPGKDELSNDHGATVDGFNKLANPIHKEKRVMLVLEPNVCVSNRTVYELPQSAWFDMRVWFLAPGHRGNAVQELYGRTHARIDNAPLLNAALYGQKMEAKTRFNAEPLPSHWVSPRLQEKDGALKVSDDGTFEINPAFVDVFQAGVQNAMRRLRPIDLTNKTVVMMEAGEGKLYYETDHPMYDENHIYSLRIELELTVIIIPSHSSV